MHATVLLDGLLSVDAALDPDSRPITAIHIAGYAPAPTAPATGPTRLPSSPGGPRSQRAHRCAHQRHALPEQWLPTWPSTSIFAIPTIRTMWNGLLGGGGCDPPSWHFDRLGRPARWHGREPAMQRRSSTIRGRRAGLMPYGPAIIRRAYADWTPLGSIATKTTLGQTASN
jgi:hypothetical protein